MSLNDPQPREFFPLDNANFNSSLRSIADASMPSEDSVATTSDMAPSASFGEKPSEVSPLTSFSRHAG
jgi:hypothetical protein